MDQRPIIPITQLINPVRASYQDECDCKGQKHEEDLEPSRQYPFLCLSALRSNVPESELCAEGNEDAERDDLE